MTAIKCRSERDSKKKMEVKLNLHKCSEERPSASGEYILFALEGRYVAKVHYSKVHDLFNAFDRDDEKTAKSNSIGGQYWAEIPPEVKKKPRRRRSK